MTLNSNRFLILIGLALLLGACQNDFQDVGDNVDKPESSTVCSRNLSAIKNYLNNMRPTATRAGEVSIMPYVVNGDTVMYVANYEEGWEVFSNDNRLPMVLMKSETGSFNPYFLDRSNPFNCYFEDAAKSLQSIGIDNTEDPEGMWQVYSSTSISTPTDPGTTSQYTMVGMACETTETVYTPKGGRLSTKWGQGVPYNQFTPFYKEPSTIHSLVGCGAVAAGQFIYFYQKYFNPSMTTVTDAIYDSTTNTYSFSGNSNNVWSLFDDGMDKSIVNNSERMKPTALFLGYVGVEIFTYYGKYLGEGSSSNWLNIVSFLNNTCRLSLKHRSFDYQELVNTLKYGIPVFADSYGDQISGTNTTPDVGHAYLIDFANTKNQDVYEVYAYVSSGSLTPPDISPSYPIDNPYGPSLDYYRVKYGSIDYKNTMRNTERWIKMNWGWNGSCDEILINADLSTWIVQRSNDTLKFNKNYITVK